MNSSSSDRISTMKKYYDKYECIEVIFTLMVFPFLFGVWITVQAMYNYETTFDLKVAAVCLVIIILSLLLWIAAFFELIKRKYSYKKRIDDTIKYEDIKDDYYRVVNIM